MEQLLHKSTSKSKNTVNPDKPTKTANEDSSKYSINTAKTCNLKNQLNTAIHTTNHSSIWSPDENPTDAIGKDSLLDDACEISIKIDENYSNHCKKLMQYSEKIKSQ